MTDSKRPQDTETGAPVTRLGDLASRKRHPSSGETPESGTNCEKKDPRLAWQEALTSLHRAEWEATTNRDVTAPLKVTIAPLADLTSSTFQVSPRKAQSGCILKGHGRGAPTEKTHPEPGDGQGQVRLIESARKIPPKQV